MNIVRVSVAALKSFWSWLRSRLRRKRPEETDSEWLWRQW